MGNREKLREIMKKRGITRKRMGHILGVHKNTVDAWLAPDHASIFRKMPGNMIELLIFKIEEVNK